MKKQACYCVNKYRFGMNKINALFLYVIVASIFFSCKKNTIPITPPPVNPPAFKVSTVSINGVNNGLTYYVVNNSPVIKISFSSPVDQNAADANISLKNNAGATISLTTSFENGDSVAVVKPSTLNYITQYTLTVPAGLKSKQGAKLQSAVNATLITSIDSTDKFPQISDSALLTLVQQQTFKYFWDLGHPVSGMAREGSSTGDICTTGGTGFGIMSMLVAINRNFISRTDGLNRIQKIISFYKDKCTAYHGAFAHWINGSTGATIPFSTLDDGADLVETSYLMQGLLCARQYFNLNNTAEDTLRNNINTLWNGVQWSWFRQNDQNALFWHWSPGNGWAINLQISGWDEALIVYVLASSSNTDSIPKIVYDNGWANNGGMKNGKTFFGIQLPLGPDYGGPLFFSHYSFLGINPNNLSDAYANYWTQDTAQSKINFLYCVNNPQKYNGYSNLCWGLTASNDNNGYSAHSPTNDDGVISPTAAISSLPYTPKQSMDALKFFYYKLGDKIWGQYGFTDAFNLTDVWFANSYLAIDQGPQIVMIENYRSELLWDLLMSCSEIKTGMKRLGFQSPYL